MALIDDSTFYGGVQRNQTAADSRRRSGEGLVDEPGRRCRDMWRASAAGLPIAIQRLMVNCWRKWSRPSTGSGWRNGFRCGSNWTMCPKGWNLSAGMTASVQVQEGAR
jgi:hypothetical protein